METTHETLPPILTPQHIADYLSISRFTVYELMRLPAPEGIPNFKPGGDKGRSRRVRREDFLGWLERKAGAEIELVSDELGRN